MLVVLLPVVYLVERLRQNAWTNGKTLTVRAYCPNKCCCRGWADGYFANGEPAQGKAIASKFYPFGTRLHVSGYGEATVKDRSKHECEVFFGFDPNSSCTPHEKALQWGVRRVKVKILERPD